MATMIVHGIEIHDVAQKILWKQFEQGITLEGLRSWTNWPLVTLEALREYWASMVAVEAMSRAQTESRLTAWLAGRLVREDGQQRSVNELWALVRADESGMKDDPLLSKKMIKSLKMLVVKRERDQRTGAGTTKG